MSKVKESKALEAYYSDKYKYEIGIDEVGRGPMLGRVYSAAVILPKDNSFNHALMKDSKRFTSKKKINEAADYIKENALIYSVVYETEEMIDKINIRQATLKAMHSAINNCLTQLKSKDVVLLVDGNDFKPYMLLDIENEEYNEIPNICIKGGDNKYAAIAAASILAKVERDAYIEELCKEYPYLDEKYDILKNKGYGTKNHMVGIKKYGITAFHRRSYGICKDYQVNL
jgi:ribonuclease HII|tara:strand:- start:3652 stop:4338 length:687 start_codon:yes stop_codon:yes gene_type:complete